MSTSDGKIHEVYFLFIFSFERHCLSISVFLGSGWASQRKRTKSPGSNRVPGCLQLAQHRSCQLQHYVERRAKFPIPDAGDRKSEERQLKCGCEPGKFRFHAGNTASVARTESHGTTGDHGAGWLPRVI